MHGVNIGCTVEYVWAAEAEVRLDEVRLEVESIGHVRSLMSHSGSATLRRQLGDNIKSTS